MTNSSPAKPYPDTSDPLVAEYWAGTRQRRLRVPRCAECGHLLWPPEPVCPRCLAERFVWEEIPPSGVLWSYAVYHRALDPALAGDVPYAVGLVELAGGVRMYGLIEGQVDGLRVGLPVTAAFHQVDDAVTLVLWCVEQGPG